MLLNSILEFVCGYVVNSVDYYSIINVVVFIFYAISNVCFSNSVNAGGNTTGNQVTTSSSSESDVDETEDNNDDINPYDYEIPTFDRTITGYITGRTREIRAERELARQEAEQEAARQLERRARTLEYVRTRLASGDFDVERRTLSPFNAFFDVFSLNYSTLFGLCVLIGVPVACLVLYLADYGLRTRPGADYESDTFFLYIRRFFVFIFAILFFSVCTGVLALFLACCNINFYYVRFTYQIIFAVVGYSVLLLIALIVSIRYNLTPAARRLAREAAAERERQAAITRVREEIECRREETVRRNASLAEDDRSGRNTPANTDDSIRRSNSSNGRSTDNSNR